MSQHNKVLYVNPPESFTAAAKKTDFRITPITDNLYTLDLPIRTFPVGQIPSKWIFTLFNYWNNIRIARNIRKACAKLNMSHIVHINDNDVYRGLYLKELLNPSISVYYRRDWLFDVDYWKRHVLRVEKQLAKKSDLVLTNSPYLCDTIKDYNPHVFCIGQGVDISLYDANISYNLPPELEGINSPIVGYTGVLSSLRLDADLIYDVAEQMPELSFVLLGPEDTFFEKHKLHKLANVFFIASKPPHELPAYIAHFDICINPQVLNDTTKGNYPRKIDEYLAMGKPVVATETPTMRLFDGVVSLCTDAKTYINAITHELQHDTPTLRADRIKVAQSHTWHNCVLEMYQKIEQYEGL